MTGSEPVRSPRALAAVCTGLIVAAALLWGASTATWFVVEPAERAPVDVAGAVAAPSVTGLALLALAGVAGVVATGGVLRRLVGVLLGAAGAGAGAIAVRAMLSSPFATDGPGVPEPRGVAADVLRHQPTETTAAPLLAVAAGAVLLAVGVVVAVWEHRLARLGARYAAPGTRRVEADPDRAAWLDLDAGRDPTTGPVVDRGDDPGAGAGRV